MLGGYFWTVLVAAVYTLAALFPMRRPHLLGLVSWVLGHLSNELPFLLGHWLIASTVVTLGFGALDSPAGIVLVGMAALTSLGLVEVVTRASQAGEAAERALARDLGAAWPVHTPSRARTRRIARVLFAPLPLRHPRVQRVKNIDYGNAGRRNRLDVYRGQWTREGSGPVLIHFHGGHFRPGGKSREARPLMHRFARHGWLCVSADYRLGEAGRFPNALIDAKMVIAWVRQHAREYGADPSMVIVAGSSSGAHLASMTALTANDPVFQPGFEGDDTSVDGAVCLYGHYGVREFATFLPSSPAAYVTPAAPPFLVVHGTHDTVAPVDTARVFVDRLSTASTNPVAYVELPGAQHSFDLVHSLRYGHVLDAIEVFTAYSRARVGC